MRIHRFRFFKGEVKTDALWFSTTLFSQTDMTARIISMWWSGCTLFRIDKDYLVTFPRPRFLDARRASGQVLVKQSGVLSNVYLTPAEVKALEVASDHLVLLQAGSWRVVTAAEQIKEHPAQWLDLSAYHLTSAKTLGQVQHCIEPVVTTEPKTARAIFSGERYQASKQQQALLAQWRVSSKGTTSENTKPPTLRFGLFQNLLGVAMGTLGVAMGTLGHMLSGQPTNRSSSPSAQHSTKVQTNSSWRQKIATRIMRSGLGALLGRKQAKYINKMMSMFEQGDIENALKHAIPLSDAKDAMQPGAPSLWLPKIRDGFNIFPNQQASSGHYYLQDQFFDSLQSLYESTFENLDRAGRYQEAAFVLAELCRDAERAVEYLQKHKQFQLAAELAEGRQLEPAWVVKQWLLAGNLQRAMEIADYTGCYTAAVNLVTRQSPQAAAELRIYFAKAMAASGQYEAAIDMVWPIRNDCPAVHQWMAKIIQQGGPNGARILIKKVQITQSFDRELQALFNNRSKAEYPNRKAAVEEMLSSPPTNAIMRLAEYALRSQLRDLSAGVLQDHKAPQRLMKLCRNSLLVTDVKPLPIPQHSTVPTHRLAQQAPVKQLDWQGQEGTRTEAMISDIVPLTRGRYLLALGELGASIVNRQGRVIKTFYAPCHRIIFSDHHNQAILLANRDHHVTLQRLDLTDNRVTPWLQIQVDCYANSFDGRVWLATQANQLLALDLQQNKAKVVWQVSDLPGQVQMIARAKDSVALLLSTEEVWRYQLPSMTLKQRQPSHRYATNGNTLRAIRADGALIQLQTDDDAKEVGSRKIEFIHPSGRQTADTTVIALGEPDWVHFSHHWVNFRNRLLTKNCCWYFVDCERQAPKAIRMVLKTHQQQSLQMRMFDNACVLFDHNGKVMHIDLEHGETIEEFQTMGMPL